MTKFTRRTVLAGLAAVLTTPGRSDTGWPNRPAIAPTPRNGQGFGLGFVVRTQTGQNPRPGSPGEFYWVGAYGTAFWVDPKERLIAILMTQTPIDQVSHYRSLLRNLVYQALVN